MTLMFISLQQWACPPNINYRDTEVFSTLSSNISHGKIDQCPIVGYISLTRKIESSKYQSNWGVFPNTKNIIRPEPKAVFLSVLPWQDN